MGKYFRINNRKSGINAKSSNTDVKAKKNINFL